MSRFVGTTVAVLFVCFLAAGPILAAGPTLTVTDLGLNGSSNREWLVEVAPDPLMFTTTDEGTGGSLGVELAFSVTGSDLLVAAKNAVDWPWDNPGNNPFTSSVTEGVVVDLAADTVFASLGSEFFTTGDPVEVLTIETQGSGETTLSWGGQTLLPGTPEEYIGSRIAQAGQNFDSFTGSLAVGAVVGDYDDSGQVEQGDIDLVLLNWNAPAPADWINDKPVGNVGQAELDVVRQNWGTSVATPTSAAVPEPTSVLMLLIGGILLGRMRRS